jgi:hypothetical protein
MTLQHSPRPFLSFVDSRLVRVERGGRPKLAFVADGESFGF